MTIQTISAAVELKLNFKKMKKVKNRNNRLKINYKFSCISNEPTLP